MTTNKMSEKSDITFSRLTLISTRQHDSLVPLMEDAAVSMGYVFQELLYEKGKPFNSNKLCEINLFHFDVDFLRCTEHQVRVLSLLRDPSHAINFCVLDRNQIDADLMFSLGEILTEFHEILFIPCAKEEILARVHRFAKGRKNSENNYSLATSNRILLQHFSSLNLIGQSEVFLRTLKRIKKISNFDVPVLIEGETGTGKENSARAIHYLGARQNHAFVPVNCATLPDQLLENELFGHEKGAFTDAKSSQDGLVGLASGGTLFLDEIDCLTPKAQAALLRFLQTYEYRPLGSHETRHADVRVICATNSCLQEQVKLKKFREDLLFRINVLHVHMPPLRDRCDDILVITEALIKRFSEQQNIPLKRLSPAAITFYQQHDWPGNVRELENTLLRQFLLTDDTFIYPEYAAEDATTEGSSPKNPFLNQGISFQRAKIAAIEEFEQRFVEEILSITHGNVSKAAKISGKERRAFGKLVKKYKIRKDQFSEATAYP